MPTSSKATDDFSQRQLLHVEELRREIVDCLAPGDPQRTSVLSGVSPARKSRGGRKRKHRSSEAQKVPAVDRGYTATGAESRPPQFSRPLVDGRLRLVRAIWELNEKEIASILAHYSPSDERRNQSAWLLATKLARRCQKPQTRQQARIIAWVILRGGGAADCRTWLGIPEASWHSSYTRKLADQMKVTVERLDIDSLLAWHNKWSAPTN